MFSKRVHAFCIHTGSLGVQVSILKLFLTCPFSGVTQTHPHKYLCMAFWQIALIIQYWSSAFSLNTSKGNHLFSSLFLVVDTHSRQWLFSSFPHNWVKERVWVNWNTFPDTCKPINSKSEVFGEAQENGQTEVWRQAVVGLRQWEKWSASTAAIDSRYKWVLYKCVICRNLYKCSECWFRESMGE